MNKQGLFSIGEVAQMFHLSAGSLRHYEKIGLLQPEYIDPASGYRYYSSRQFECLNTIRYLRALDMPLSQIAAFVKNRDVGKMRQMLARQKEAVIRRQQALRVIERKIDNRLAQLEDALGSELDTVRLAETAPRRIVWLRKKLSLHSYLDLEPSIRQLEGQQEDALVFLGKVGVGIEQERLLARQYDSYDLVFLLLDEEDAYQGPVEQLPGGPCAVLRFCGSHSEAPLYYEKLAAFMDSRRLRPSGFSREITMIDYGLTSDPAQFVTEIQVPVKPF